VPRVVSFNPNKLARVGLRPALVIHVRGPSEPLRTKDGRVRLKPDGSPLGYGRNPLNRPGREALEAFCGRTVRLVPCEWDQSGRVLAFLAIDMSDQKPDADHMTAPLRLLTAEACVMNWNYPTDEVCDRYATKLARKPVDKSVALEQAREDAKRLKDWKEVSEEARETGAAFHIVQSAARIELESQTLRQVWEMNRAKLVN
jgi:hypothetical protein